jgi:hypothetical protein
METEIVEVRGGMKKEESRGVLPTPIFISSQHTHTHLNHAILLVIDFK